MMLSVAAVALTFDQATKTAMVAVGPGARGGDPSLRRDHLLAWGFHADGIRESDTGAGSAPELERSGLPELPSVQAQGALSG